MSYRHIYFDKNICNGCNVCVEICPGDVFAPNPEKGTPPLVTYPEECYLEGSCVTMCPRQGAIRILTPFPLRGGFLRR